ncbi:hypothetical protein ACFQY7_07855 [Actinomadura luteofluorescens]|uniref:hypothetical protein n=1 Tax=Actinomadura luteofluorescens TaxID=46163 RepID=UPI0036259216
MGKRLLILTAAMGAGHDAVAGELARRIAPRGVEVSVVDVLDLVPLRLGHGLRRMYGGCSAARRGSTSGSTRRSSCRRARRRPRRSRR